MKSRPHFNENQPAESLARALNHGRRLRRTVENFRFHPEWPKICQILQRWEKFISYNRPELNHLQPEIRELLGWHDPIPKPDPNAPKRLKFKPRLTHGTSEELRALAELSSEVFYDILAKRKPSVPLDKLVDRLREAVSAANREMARDNVVTVYPKKRNKQ